ncbi:MAG TPA: hypothetical protein VM841_00305 [Actinomycetota bacterium]|nr:hypothetical protein [Actinomycetota bacterium]
MKRFVAAFTVAALAFAIPAASPASVAECRVLTDATGDVAGPLGTARPSRTAGASVDLTGVTMHGNAPGVLVTISVTDLKAPPTVGTGGAVYTTFWNVGADRFFAQALRVGREWSFSAGRAAGIDDAIPQQGTPVDGRITGADIRLRVPALLAGSPRVGGVLQQVRAKTQETLWQTPEALAGQTSIQPVAAMADAAGGPEGGRFLIGGACLPGISADGERCLVTTDLPGDATTGALPAAVRGTGADRELRDAPASAADPATDILALQMGSNVSTLIIEIALARLDAAMPTGADAQRWEVSWNDGRRVTTAFAERRTTGATFGYLADGAEYATTGSLDRVGAVVRILVPRHEIGAAEATRMNSIVARGMLVTGAVRDVRDIAPDIQAWSVQYVAGVSCVDQARAACPVALDVNGDAGPVVDHEGRTVPAYQPASDLLAVGASAPDGTLVLSVRVADAGAPPPDGFTMQGWTVSWTWRGIRYMAQAERTRDRVVFRTRALGPADKYGKPTGPAFIGTDEASGSIDAQAGVIRIVLRREYAGSPYDGAALTDMGALSWVMNDGKVAEGAYGPARHVTVDETPVAPYRMGLGCSA